jgi:hypothetical protein
MLMNPAIEALARDYKVCKVNVDIYQPYCLLCQIYPGLRCWKTSSAAHAGSSPIVASPVLRREVNKRLQRLLHWVP